MIPLFITRLSLWVERQPPWWKPEKPTDRSPADDREPPNQTTGGSALGTRQQHHRPPVFEETDRHCHQPETQAANSSQEYETTPIPDKYLKMSPLAILNANQRHSHLQLGLGRKVKTTFRLSRSCNLGSGQC